MFQGRGGAINGKPSGLHEGQKGAKRSGSCRASHAEERGQSQFAGAESGPGGQTWRQESSQGTIVVSTGMMMVTWTKQRLCSSLHPTAALAGLTPRM